MSDLHKTEEVLKRANIVNRLLPSAVDDGCEFLNGGGFIQHASEQVTAYINALDELIAVECGSDSEALTLFRKEPRGFTGRYLDDGRTIAYKLWFRLICIGPDNKEWGQPSIPIGNHPGFKSIPWPNVAVQDFKPNRT